MPTQKFSPLGRIFFTKFFFDEIIILAPQSPEIKEKLIWALLCLYYKKTSKNSPNIKTKQTKNTAAGTNILPQKAKVGIFPAAWGSVNFIQGFHQKDVSRLTFHQKELKKHDMCGNDRGIVHIRQLLAFLWNIWNSWAQLGCNWCLW